ncbi:helix-turn-helix domain-containing protein [Streptomyces sp. NPDC059783]|uniref:helix-turn-helix domain-containing protein n=1 Tax=Streptomyces sp. NPDC059783 TaxID=3346944 RepID=UPI003648EF6B
MQARGEQIRRKREEAGHGLKAFAQLAGISASWLSRIERNQSKEPSPEVLRRIADGLNVAIHEVAQHE